MFDLTSENKFMKHLTRPNSELLRDHNFPNHFCYLETLKLEKKALQKPPPVFKASWSFICTQTYDYLQ